MEGRDCSFFMFVFCRHVLINPSCTSSHKSSALRASNYVNKEKKKMRETCLSERKIFLPRDLAMVLRAVITTCLGNGSGRSPRLTRMFFLSSFVPSVDEKRRSYSQQALSSSPLTGDALSPFLICPFPPCFIHCFAPSSSRL